MTLRQYVIIMMLSTTLCWVSWAFVILNVDPYTSGLLGFAFFYISFFFALLGTSSLIVFGLYRLIIKPTQPMFRYVQSSFRTAFILSLLIIGSLFLSGAGYLKWWNVALLVGLSIVTLIFFYMSKRSELDPAADTTL